MERRDPESVVQAWLGAVDGLEGRRRDSETAQNALAFLMRLENDPFYASPEQTRGGDKDSRGLVYSLALFLFERLTGHHPFVESLSPLECRIQQAKGRRVGTNNLCHLPSPLRQVLHHALSPFAEDRYDDIGHMRSDIERWLRGEQTIAQRAIEMASARTPSAAAAAVPRRQPTMPPPTPKAATRRAFAPADTLQGAVTVRPASLPAATSPGAVPTPWLWPAISAGFAVVAAVALFVAVQVGSKSQPSSAHAATATAPQRAADPAMAKGHAASVFFAVAGSAPEGAEAVVSEAVVSEVLGQPSTGKSPTVASLPAEEEQKSSEMKIVDVIRQCVPQRALRGGMDFGISVLFTDEGSVKRSFTGRLPLPASAVKCLKEGLASLSTPSDDERGHMMTYDLYVSVSSERTRSHQAKH